MPAVDQIYIAFMYPTYLSSFQTHKIEKDPGNFSNLYLSRKEDRKETNYK